jgi:hypothetical protein
VDDVLLPFESLFGKFLNRLYEPESKVRYKALKCGYPEFWGFGNDIRV